MKREISKLLTETARMLVFALLLPVVAVFAQRHAINLTTGPARPPYSDGIIVGNTLYVAGLQGTDRNGKFPAGGFAPQARQVLENIQRVVRAAGFQMSDVVSVNVYLTDIHDFPAMNGIYRKFFPDPKPTRTTVQVAALSNGAVIEISAIAVKMPSVHAKPASKR